MLKKPTPPSKPPKPKVIIDLPILLEAFCRHLFKTPDDQQEISASRSHSIGRAINGYLSKADFKPVLPEPENPVIFIVPETKNNWYSLQTKYLYFSIEDKECFIDRVNTEFANWVEIHFREGYAMNMDQLTIVESVLDILNVRMNSTNFDAIKKHDYRRKKTEARRRSKYMLMQRKLAT